MLIYTDTYLDKHTIIFNIDELVLLSIG